MIIFPRSVKKTHMAEVWLLLLNCNLGGINGNVHFVALTLGCSFPWLHKWSHFFPLSNLSQQISLHLCYLKHFFFNIILTFFLLLFKNLSEVHTVFFYYSPSTSVLCLQFPCTLPFLAGLLSSPPHIYHFLLPVSEKFHCCRWSVSNASKCATHMASIAAQ